MKIVQLIYILKVAEVHSISRAADELYISKQNISTAISNLEDELGLIIFNRTTKGATPTADGETILEYAQEIVALYEKMRSLSSKEPIVKLNMDTHISTILFSDILFRLKEQLPDVQINISVNKSGLSIIESVSRGEIDLAVLNFYSEESLPKLNNYKNIMVDIIAEDHIVLLAHKHLKLHTYNDLLHSPVPILQYGAENDIIAQTISKLSPREIITVSDIESYHFMLENALAVGTSTKFLIHDPQWRYSDDIITIPCDFSNNQFKIKIALIAYKRPHDMSVIKNISQIIKDKLKTLPC